MATFEFRPNRVAQAYGYLACLISIVIFVIGLNQVVEHGLDYASPQMASRWGYGEQVSYETFKLNYVTRRAAAIRGISLDRNRGEPDAADLVGLQRDSVVKELDKQFPLPTEDLLRKMYEDERKSRTEQSMWYAKRGLAVGIQSLIISLIIFAIHWRWLQRLGRSEDGVPGLL
jgi:hypothetical protein